MRVGYATRLTCASGRLHFRDAKALNVSFSASLFVFAHTE
jgi:hypothetical protein